MPDVAQLFIYKLEFYNYIINPYLDTQSYELGKLLLTFKHDVSFFLILISSK